jgi:hypothetical protein
MEPTGMGIGISKSIPTAKFKVEPKLTKIFSLYGL